MVRFRDHLVPILRLHRLFGIPGAQEDLLQALLVVVEHEGHACAVVVDGLLGQQQVVIKTVGEALGDVAGVAGAAILGDGRVGLILDVAGLIRASRGDGSQEAA